MNSEYGTMFKRLINERNELRKYITDICNLLGIDTSQSVLGANCLEFYAVLSSTAKNKIKDLQEQLKRKEQECNKFKQTLAEIKRIAEENIRIADLEGLNGVYRRGLAEQILQKISECEVENE